MNHTQARLRRRGAPSAPANNFTGPALAAQESVSMVTPGRKPCRAQDRSDSRSGVHQLAITQRVDELSLGHLGPPADTELFRLAIQVRLRPVLVTPRLATLASHLRTGCVGSGVRYSGRLLLAVALVSKLFIELRIFHRWSWISLLFGHDLTLSLWPLRPLRIRCTTRTPRDRA